MILHDLAVTHVVTPPLFVRHPCRAGIWSVDSVGSIVEHNGRVAKEQIPQDGEYPYVPASVELRAIDRRGARSILSRRPPDGEDWAEDYPTAGDLEAAKLLLERLQAGEAPGPFGMYEIREAATGMVIGGIGFHHAPHIDGSVEVGYGIVPDKWDRGFGTEALEEAVELAQRSGARKVTARTLPTNVASRRVLEKAGFGLAEIREGYALYEIDLGL